ncbi:MAG: tRNA 2-thiouridine(34) synthase MnmA [Candidatus Wildermuthbacteria bacterium]|nr:tRNA 2-thiouridine(34) synthase MnmA [Candidatus Wildermuthbacteria bacterium]
MENVLQKKKKGTVFVALSGGVDSSVAAALLKRAGFGVVGVYMKCWTADDPLYKGCTSLDDERSARLAASHLEIPFYSWNFIKEYKEKVVQYLINGYMEGATPNPDIMCNKEIKFGLFYEKAMKLGADFIATGHYARIRRYSSTSVILEGRDKNKDQSYFLSFIHPEVLSRVLFPIGEYTKPQVRELAKKFGLPNAERKDSQGICFIGKLDFSDFLAKHIPLEPGNIVDILGNVLGKHAGLGLYTIGQRKGIKLSGGPYFVVRKEYAANILVVSKNESDILCKNAKVKDVRWLSLQEPKDLDMEVRLRYRQKATPVRLEKTGDNSYALSFKDPQRAATPGQFAAFYQGEEMVGAGVLTN